MNPEEEVKVDKSITVEVARQAIAQERQKRAVDCGKELTALLQKFNCEIVAVPMINNEGKIIAQSQIVAKE